MSCLILEDMKREESRERKRRAELVFALMGTAFFAGIALGYFWAWRALTS